MRNDEHIAGEVLSRTSDLLEFLSAVAREVGPAPARNLALHPFVLHSSELPTHPSVGVGPRGDRATWVSVARVPAPAPVAIPTHLGNLLEDRQSLNDPRRTPLLSSSRLSAHVASRIEVEASERRSPLVAADLTPQDIENLKAALETEIRAEATVELNRWVEDIWTPWATAATDVVAAREAYGRLYDLHLRAEAENATHEIVIGHARLRVANEGIDAPMLVTRVALTMDADNATIAIVPEGATELEIDSLEGTAVQGLEALARLRSQLRDNPPDVWSDEERKAARRQVVAPLGLDARLVEDRPSASSSITIDDSWVILLRKRPAREERFYDDLAQKIQSERFLPQALASVLSDDDQVADAMHALMGQASMSDGSADRLLMPLPSNEEQERIARQLATSRGVTVQGPPGTGKSHAIANLVSHLVAQGKRVLVTAQNDQALTVLREKIPAELRDLSLAVVGSSALAVEQLRGSVQTLQDSISSLDVAKARKRIAALGTTIDDLRDQQRRLDAALVDALRGEHARYDLPHGSASAPDVARWLTAHAYLDQIPDRIPAGAAMPLSVEELDEFARLSRQIEPADAAAAALELPVADWLPTPAALSSMLDLRERLRADVTRLDDGGLRVESIDTMTPTGLADLATTLRQAAAEQRRLSGDWEDAWAQRVRHKSEIAEWVAHQASGVRQRLARTTELMNGQAGHDVVVPEGDPNVLLPMLSEWRARLAAGKKISFLAGKPLKELASSVTVDGYTVTTPGQIDLIIGEVRLRSDVVETHRLMTQALAPIDAPVPPPGPMFVFEARELIELVDSVRTWWSDAYPKITSMVAPFVTADDPAGSPKSLESAAGLVDQAGSRLEERRLSASITALETRLIEQTSLPKSSPLWTSLVSALQLADTASWERTLAEARRVDSLRPIVARREQLAVKLAAGAAPRWSRAIVESRGSTESVGDPDDAPLAWARATASSWLADLHESADVSSLMVTSHESSRRLREAVLEAANLSARIELKTNLKDSRRRALDTWLTAIRRVGKGTGKNAPRFQAEARDALPAAMGAIPVWIMPIHRVMENFSPTESDLFDVVIVDESSQCDLLSLGVLALGEKAVVVGDDKQTTPLRPGTSTDRIAALQQQFLRGVSGARLLTIDESLYSIAGRVFPSVIALREHFRCVPAVIDFSNRYYDGKILPLREVTRAEIGAPVRAVKVEAAVSYKIGSHRVNPDEARAIADQVAACIADPAYEGLTFGVVTMMSGPQSNHIQDAVRERIGDEEFERRRLRVGNPPLFQGDERNVVFISTVAHDNSFAATSLQYSQWANVAVSRAQDQLWVFYSMDPTTLHHEDQRRAIIDYAINRSDERDNTAVFDLTESKFERDVLTRILDRGYDVTAQHKVGAYRIDFVVTVASGARVAVECDGDSYHGPDQWANDVGRQRVLERLGWEFWRIRASQFYLEPESSLEPLWDRLEALRAEAREREEQRARQAALAAEREHAALLERARVERETARAAEALAHETAQSAPKSDKPPHATERGGSRREGDGTAPGKPASRPSNLSPAADGPRGEAPKEARARPQDLPMERDSHFSVIRRWAIDNGYDVGSRGRLPQEVLRAFAASGATGEHTSPESKPSTEAPSDIGRRPPPNASSGKTTASSAAWRESPPGAAVLDAWVRGRMYTSRGNSDVIDLRSGATLSNEMPSTNATRVLQKMTAIKPNGGSFKLGDSGLLVTLVNERPTFVTWVGPEEWFPGHIS